MSLLSSSLYATHVDALDQRWEKFPNDGHLCRTGATLQADNNPQAVVHYNTFLFCVSMSDELHS